MGCAPQRARSPLIQSADRGQLETLKALVQSEDVNQRAPGGWTALMYAAHRGNAQAVQILLDAGADPNLRSERMTGNTQAPIPSSSALAEALEQGHGKVAQQLLDANAEVRALELSQGAGLCDLPLLERLYGRYPHLNEATSVMYTPSPLILATRKGQLTCMQWLLEHGADPNFEAHATTPLIAAVGIQSSEAAALLLKHGADPNQVSGLHQTTPLLHAATKQNQSTVATLQMLDLLLQAGADPAYRSNTAYYKHQTALEYVQADLARIRAKLAGDANVHFRQRYGADELAHREAVIDRLKQALKD